MKLKPTLQCHGCKKQFPRNELIPYIAFNTITEYKYCPKCHDERKAYDDFKAYIFHAFGEHANWPRINKERKILQDTYGYTTRTIVNTLDYLSTIKKWNIFSMNLSKIITPPIVEEMLAYRKANEIKSNMLISAFINEINHQDLQKIKARENIKEKEDWNIDDYFFED